MCSNVFYAYKQKYHLDPLYRGADFPFQKSAFSVWENSEFRFKGTCYWKFRLTISTVHTKFRSILNALKFVYK